MPRAKERVKRAVVKELRRAHNAEDAAQVIEELQESVADAAEKEIGDKVPGTIIGNRKVPYTYAYLCQIFPIVSFMPEETVLLTYNGVSVQTIKNVEMHVPLCFKRIYEQHRRALNMPVTLPDNGFEPVIELGAGALSKSA